MASDGEKNHVGEKDVDQERTVLLEDDPDATQLADPDATQLADADATQLADPDATQLADAAATQLVDAAATQLVDAAPTQLLDDDAAPAAEGDPAPADDAPELADGIDALDDPYFQPAVPEDLTSAHSVVAIPSPVESLPERKRRLPRWAVALLVLLAVCAAGGAAYLTYEFELWGGRTVPEVVGLSEDEATEALSKAGFGAEVEYRAGDGNYGTVLDCTPAQGRRADPSAGVTLLVAAERTIPSVVGLSEDEATEALYAAGVSDLSITRRNSDEAAGTVLSVDPAEGEAFRSSDPVTLVVARSYAVPAVMGLSASDALALLEDEGLAGTVSYVESNEPRGTVVGSSPEVGAEVGAGTEVELSVSSLYPSSPLALLDYFDCAPEDLSTYLADQGFVCHLGEVYAASGNARAAYEGPGGDMLQITEDPETGDLTGSSSADVLASGAGVGGVRLALAQGSLPAGATSETEAGVRAVMEACGLDGLLDVCTQDNVALPAGETVDEDVHFACGYGRQGDYTWAVVIGGREGQTRVVALAAPTAHFEGLAPEGGTVCDYVAYADLLKE